MKIRIGYIFILTTLAFLAAANRGFAQDGGMPEMETADPERDRLEREKILYSPGEGEVRYILKSSSTTSTQNSATTSPVTKESTTSRESAVIPETLPASSSSPALKTKPPQPDKSTEKPARQDDDSILSFNFLYYIIQKYKMQDIID